MYNQIVLTLILCTLLWVAVGLTIIAYVLRQILRFRRWAFTPPRVSDVMPTRKAVKLSVPEYVAARVATYAIIRYIGKKMK